VELRDYQKETVSSCREHFKKGKKRVLVFAPTGFGKTIVAKNIAESALSLENPILFTAHRRKLVEQTIEKFSSLDKNISVVMGQNKRFDPDKLLQIGTLQTIKNREFKTPKLIIFDEVHYGYKSDMIQGIINKFPEVPIIGLSATPIDTKGYLLEGFDAIVDDYQTIDLIKMGYLVDLEIYSPVQIDLSGVSIASTGDYKSDELNKVMDLTELNDSIIDIWIKYSQNRKTLAFCVSINHARGLAKRFNERGIKTGVVYSDLHEDLRVEVYNKFKNNEISVLCNVDILTAGYDEPSIGCVLLARPSKSLILYLQMVGRGLRLYGSSISESILNGKPNCILLDCSNAIEEHDIPTKKRTFEFAPKFSKTIDRQLEINVDLENRETVIQEMPKEKHIYLKKIGSLLDKYEGKIYKKESELQEDVNNYLKKTGYFWWRQNSGKTLIENRWVSFTNVSGLPDNTLFFKMTSIYIGIELKLPRKSFTDKQKITVPKMIKNKILYYVADCVREVYNIIEHIEKCITLSDDGIFIHNNIYKIWEEQVYYRKKLKLEDEYMELIS